jgi:hypothetical protein
MRVLFFTLLSLISVSAEIIPSTNLVDWTANVTVGVFGGIPHRTTIFATLTPGDTDVQLQAAVTACTSNQVVFMPAGTYEINAAVTLKSGVTVRGAGKGLTILRSSATAGLNVFTTTAGSQSATNNNGIGDVAKGATNVTVTSTSGMVVDRMIYFANLYQTNLVWSPDPPDSSEGPRWMFDRKVITAINGNIVTFWPPLQWPLYASLDPIEHHETAMGPRMIGIEDLTIDGTGRTNGTRIQLRGCLNFWVKNCELKAMGGRGIDLTKSLFVEIADNDFNGMTFSGATVLGIAGGPAGNGSNSGMYAYNNWFDGVRDPIMLEEISYSVIAYNFTTNSGDSNTEMTDGSFSANHAGHSAMNLWEGNIGENFQSDPAHGSTSHQTLFRNHFHGLNPTHTTFIRLIDPNRVQRWFNVVGNVLGTDATTWLTYDLVGSPGASTTRTIYRLGYPNQGNNTIGTNDIWVGVSGGASNDVEVATTLLRHANYDYFNDAIVYDPSIPDHDLPNSLYLTSRPEWFGFISWPPVDPATPTLRTAQIPAWYRYLNGSDPGPAMTSTVSGNAVIGGNAVLK